MCCGRRCMLGGVHGLILEGPVPRGPESELSSSGHRGLDDDAGEVQLTKCLAPAAARYGSASVELWTA